MRARLVALFTFAVLALGGSASAASAAPVWNLDLHHAPTNFTPSQEADYWLDIYNVGDAPSSGPVTVTLSLPAGITRKEVIENFDVTAFNTPGLTWSCPGAPGDSTFTCTTTGPIPRHAALFQLVFVVNVDPGASGEPTATAAIEGGGAAKAADAEELTPISTEPAPFGIFAPSFEVDFFEADGLTPVRESGAHPDLATFPFDFNLVNEPTSGNDRQVTAAENIRDLHVDTPPGFVGAPTAVGECTQAEFTTFTCPASSQVGRIDIHTYPIQSSSTQTYSRWTEGVFNLSHPRGVITDLGFNVAGNPVHIKVSLNAANHYAITSEVPNINETLPAFGSKLTLWGVPAEHTHDYERCKFFNGAETTEECSTDLKPVPFLSVPSQCNTEHVTRLHHYDSWDNTEVFGPELTYTAPGETTYCDRPRFEPDVEIVPTGKQANTPTGLDVHVKIAQNNNPNALATPPVKRFTVRLPEGMSFSPSFADGLSSCTLAQMQLGNNDPIECPDASRIGEVTLHTPLLPKSAEGSMYLAAQGDNPFGSTFALLLVLHDTEERGALIKIPGKIEVDETTGRITTVFNDTPQFPFDDLTLKFRSGSRAPLVSPPTCGKQTIGVEVASYAQPQNPVDASNTYEVTEGPNGTPCPPESSKRPFKPSFSGGTLNPVAGAFSTFLFRLSRSDDEQELSQVTTNLPEGLVAKIAGVPLCPEQAIASISTALGAGRQELAHPACPAASQIGSVSAGLGAGPGPNYFLGKVYLAGPYKGAPLSLAVVAPGIAGPYDLGNVVVRAALYVDPDTTKVRAVSDPFPTILHGVILRARDIRLRIDRPQTTINPTSCARKEVGGLITGVGGSLLSTADDSLFSTGTPFQVGSCSDLLFKPKLSLRLFGGTHRGSHPKLRAIVKFPPGGANTAFAQVALPHSEFLDQGHIGTVCTRVQFAAEVCPAASIYGTVSAKTPLLDETLSGNIYLRSSNHQLPDLVAAFRGGRISANLVGRVDSIHGGIRNTFEFVPDVPVTSATFSFFGGKKGLLVNSRNICKGKPRATAKFRGQNGDELTLRPPLKSACRKAKKKRRARHR
ncbi:MAG TPA: hypothetical protein VG898_10960 [Solirubrobacterales bacterium]|nr:hypothetical protein [Solirubrobacterales bacterium]